MRFLAQNVIFDESKHEMIHKLEVWISFKDFKLLIACSYKYRAKNSCHINTLIVESDIMQNFATRENVRDSLSTAFQLFCLAYVCVLRIKREKNKINYQLV